MKWLDDYRMKLVLVGIIAISVISSRSVKADFTFGEPINLGPMLNSPAMDITPTLTADGLELYFMTQRALELDSIWFTRRATTSDAWGQLEPISLPDASTGQYWEPDISADALSLYLTSNGRPDDRYGGSDIYVATRITKSDAWSQPVNIGPVVNTSFSEACPDISSDGLTLYFSGDPWDPESDIWITTKQATGRNQESYWSEPQNLGSVINSSNMDAAPFVTADGLVLLFHSNRPGGYGDYDLWMARRDSRDDEWRIPLNLGPTVNSGNADASPEISPNGSVLFFSSNRPGGSGDFDIWQAPIIPIVDLNGDGIVDSVDMCIIVDHWGTDEPLCDIGPMPWGDGIVDVQDLIVLAEHLFEEVPPVE